MWKKGEKERSRKGDGGMRNSHEPEGDVDWFGITLVAVLGQILLGHKAQFRGQELDNTSHHGGQEKDLG